MFAAKVENTKLQQIAVGLGSCGERNPMALASLLAMVDVERKVIHGIIGSSPYESVDSI